MILLPNYTLVENIKFITAITLSTVFFGQWQLYVTLVDSAGETWMLLTSFFKSRRKFKFLEVLLPSFGEEI